MILETKKAILSNLKIAFPDHKLYGEKVVQGLVRPCFFVDIIPIDVEKINSTMQSRSIMVDVQYMSKEDTKQKNLEMSEKLIDVFEKLTLVDNDVNPINKRFEIIDGILHFLFDLDVLIFYKETNTGPLMGQINLNGGVS